MQQQSSKCSWKMQRFQFFFYISITYLIIWFSWTFEISHMHIIIVYDTSPVHLSKRLIKKNEILPLLAGHQSPGWPWPWGSWHVAHQSPAIRVRGVCVEGGANWLSWLLKDGEDFHIIIPFDLVYSIKCQGIYIDLQRIYLKDNSFLKITFSMLKKKPCKSHCILWETSVFKYSFIAQINSNRPSILSA